LAQKDIDDSPGPEIEKSDCRLSLPAHGKLQTLRQLEEAGAAAAVLPSLFEEQIEHEESQIHSLYEFQAESFAESLSYFPEIGDYPTGTDEYLKQIEIAKRVVSIPIISGRNGTSDGG